MVGALLRASCLAVRRRVEGDARVPHLHGDAGSPLKLLYLIKGNVP
jgi:hypothetical protein